MMKKLQSNSKNIILILGLILLTSCVTVPPEEPIPEYVTELTEGNFMQTILAQEGPSLVLFHDNTYAPSKKLKGLFEQRAVTYYERIKFYSFVWPVDQEGSVFGLEVLPTMAYFNDGKELDRMKGMPASFENQSRVVAELDMWLERTVLGKPAAFLSGDFIYRYNNSPTLQVSNY